MSDLIPPPFISNSPPSPDTSKNAPSTTHSDLNQSELLGMNISLRQDVDETPSESQKSIDDWDPFSNATSEPSEPTKQEEDWASFNQNEQANQDGDDDDDDDEFTDFVDNAQESPDPQVQSETTKSLPPPPQQHSVQLVNQEKLNQPQVDSIPFDFVDAVEQVFGNVHSFNIKSDGDEPLRSSAAATALQDQVSENETWQELKKYTSINDASISLQFKWYLSNLEELYLDALSLERIAQNSKKKKAILAPNYVSSTILQPMKLEPTSNVNSENRKVLVEQQKVNVEAVNGVDSEKLTNHTTTVLEMSVVAAAAAASASSTNTSQMTNIDLSYFESQINNENRQQQQQDTTATLTQSKTPDGKKKYLDQLLKDIYVKDNESTDDNKSLSKSHQDFNSANHVINSMSEEEEAAVASRLPDLSFMKSKTLVVPTLKSTTATTATTAATTTVTK